MDWSKHKFFVGLYGEDDGSIDLMVWLMNRFDYQRRRPIVIDNVVVTNGVGAAADAAIAVGNGDCDRTHECKSVPSAVSHFGLFWPWSSAVAMHQSKHIF